MRNTWDTSYAGREGYGASVRAVAHFSFSFSAASLSLTISPTSLKGDGGLAREGRRKRVNQAECVPEPGARGLRENGEDGEWRTALLP